MEMMMMGKGVFIRQLDHWPCVRRPMHLYRIVDKWEWHRALRLYDAVPAHAFHICDCSRHRYLCRLQTAYHHWIVHKKRFLRNARGILCASRTASAALVNLLISILIVRPVEIDIAGHDICLWLCFFPPVYSASWTFWTDWFLCLCCCCCYVPVIKLKRLGAEVFTCSDNEK